MDTAREQRRDPAQLAALRPDPNEVTLLMFTSGTTAEPKGVMHTHNTLVAANQPLPGRLGVNSESVIHMASTFAHLTGMLYGVRLPTQVGGAPAVYQDVRHDERFIELIRTAGSPPRSAFNGERQDPEIPAPPSTRGGVVSTGTSPAYLVAGVRTPFGRYGGALADVRPDDIAAHVLRGLTNRLPTVGRAELDDVLLGCANQAGEDNRNVGRTGVPLAGLPVTTPGATVNRLCGSGLDAVAITARAVRSADADLVPAGGVESMTRAPFVIPIAGSAFSRATEIHDTTIGWRFVTPPMARAFGTDSMPETPENVAAEYGVSRQDQDEFALRSQECTAKAEAAGWLVREIAPVSVPQRRGSAGLVERDEHPRDTSLEALAKLRPIRPGGTVTAGNASGINDGAAVVLVASAKAVQRYGLTPLARITSGATVEVPPRVMGIGPVATRKLLGRNGLQVAEIDVVELNEAFAAQSLAVLRELGLPDHAEHVNPNGGAIALGHPLGASGARVALTAAMEPQSRRAARAVVTMCIGVGQGVSILLESA